MIVRGFRGVSVRMATAAVVVAALLGVLPALDAPAYAATSKNVIKNGNAEKGAGSTDGSTVPVPGWTETAGTTFTAVQYGASGGFPAATDPGPNNRGKNFFAGGDDDPSDSIVASQTDSLKPYAAATSRTSTARSSPARRSAPSPRPTATTPPGC